MSAIPDVIGFCHRQAEIRLSDGRLYINGYDATTWEGDRIERATTIRITYK